MSNTIVQDLNTIKTARDNMKLALEGQGQIVTKDIRTYAQAISNISGGGEVKLFDTIAHMQEDPTAQDGDLAVVYREEVQPVQEDSEFDSCIFTNTVILDTAFSDSIYGRFRSTGSGWFDGNVDMSSSSFRFDGFGESSEVRVQYESQDGITYTRTDGGEELQEFGTTIKWEDYGDPFNIVIGNFMKIGGNHFDGLYEYKTAPDTNISCLGTKFSDIYPNYTEKNTLYQYKSNLTNISLSLSRLNESDIDDFALIVFNIQAENNLYYGKTLYKPVEGYAPINDTNVKIGWLIDNDINTEYLVAYITGSAVDKTLLHYTGSGYENITILANEWQSISTYNTQYSMNITYNYKILDTLDPTQWVATYRNSLFLKSSGGTDGPLIINKATTGNTSTGTGCTVLPLYGIITKYIYAQTQLSDIKSNDFLSDKIAYGNNGVIISDGSIYNNIPYKDFLVNILQFPEIDVGTNNLYYGNNMGDYMTTINKANKLTYLKKVNNGREVILKLRDVTEYITPRLDVNNYYSDVDPSSIIYISQDKSRYVKCSTYSPLKAYIRNSNNKSLISTITLDTNQSSFVIGQYKDKIYVKSTGSNYIGELDIMTGTYISQKYTSLEIVSTYSSYHNIFIAFTKYLIVIGNVSNEATIRFIDLETGTITDRTITNIKINPSAGSCEVYMFDNDVYVKFYDNTAHYYTVKLNIDTTITVSNIFSDGASYSSGAFYNTYINVDNNTVMTVPTRFGNKVSGFKLLFKDTMEVRYYSTTIIFNGNAVSWLSDFNIYINTLTETVYITDFNYTNPDVSAMLVLKLNNFTFDDVNHIITINCTDNNIINNVCVPFMKEYTYNNAPLYWNTYNSPSYLQIYDNNTIIYDNSIEDGVTFGATFKAVGYRYNISNQTDYSILGINGTNPDIDIKNGIVLTDTNTYTEFN